MTPIHNLTQRHQYQGILIIVCLLNFIPLKAQKTYEINIPAEHSEIRKGHLDLGGKSISGKTIEINSLYIERNGKPYIPVVGEFHYSRYPNAYWDEQLKKMKAGGITVVSTYVFWNLHEKKEGVFSWEGDLNLKRFVELCQKNGLEVIVRIGPFDHGEIRNGGLPDWLYGREFEVRSNDSAYLHYVSKLYTEIAKQLQGLYFSQDGPVIGIQIENEYQHSAAPWAISYTGAEKEYTTALMDRRNTSEGVSVHKEGNSYASYGQKHMQTLKELAVQAGLQVPLYTATGWGYATIIDKGSIPVMAAYAFPFWEEGNKLSPFYLYKDLRKVPDYSPVSYDSELYPSLAAELGTGMSVIYSRRPRVPGESFLPMMVRTLGSGTNGLGYYMYHGGTTPSEGNFFYSEGSGLPNKSYDYQAPIREFGNPGPGFYGLKLINLFLQSFGSLLAPMPSVLPETNAGIISADTSTLRYAVRSDGTKGFIFMHNYQDHLKTPDLKNIRLKIKTSTEIISFPGSGSFDLQSGVSAIFPFNLQLGDLLIKTATAQPLCLFVNAGRTYAVFFVPEGFHAEFVLSGNVSAGVQNADVARRNGNTIIEGKNNKAFEFNHDNLHILVLPYSSALNAYLTGKIGKQRLVISNAIVTEDGEKLSLINAGDTNFQISVYPAVNKIASENLKSLPVKTAEKFFTSCSINVDAVRPVVEFSRHGDRRVVMDARKTDFTALSDIYIKFDYRGDRALCMMNGELQTDNLYFGEPWQIGLKRYQAQLKNNLMYFYFLPMYRDAPYLSYLDKDMIPDFSKEAEFLEIKAPEVIPEYKISLEIN